MYLLRPCDKLSAHPIESLSRIAYGAKGGNYSAASKELPAARQSPEGQRLAEVSRQERHTKLTCNDQ